jgi:hypothetical protein
MKSITNKNGNSQRNHILNDANFVHPNGPDTYIPPIILPKGIHAACHRHEKTLYFKSLEDIIIHNNKVHDYRKG